jgi:hypothetical protein
MPRMSRSLIMDERLLDNEPGPAAEPTTWPDVAKTLVLCLTFLAAIVLCAAGDRLFW